MAQEKKRDIYLVIGGNGFLGRHIVQQFLDRGDNVSCFDIVERYTDVPFYAGDITDQNSVASALRKVRRFPVLQYPPLFLTVERNNLHNSYGFTSCNNCTGPEYLL